MRELKEMICRECNIKKPINEFVRDKTKSGGFRRLCKLCMIKYSKRIHKQYLSEKKCIRCGKGKENDCFLCQKCMLKDIKRRREKRRTNKIKAVLFKGGKCQECGLKSNILAVYDFHHINSNKEKNISRMMNESWEKIKKELKKCKMLCANCHRIEENKKIEV